HAKDTAGNSVNRDKNVGSNDLIVALRDLNNPDATIDELTDKVVLKDWYYRAVQVAPIALPDITGGEEIPAAIIEGDYLKTAIGNDGTLGGRTAAEYGEEYSEGVGFYHDPEGNADFGWDSMRQDPYDGWELFSIKSDQTGLLTNNNADDNDSITTAAMEDLSAQSEFDRHIRWTGVQENQFVLQTDYLFNIGDERIRMTSKVTALTDLTNLSFLRSMNVDPDMRYESRYSTDQRGLDANGDGDFDDMGDIAVENLVFSKSRENGAMDGEYGFFSERGSALGRNQVGIYSNSEIAHNSGISSVHSADPEVFMQGATDYGEDVYYSDNSIGLAFDLGNLERGEEITVDYSYVLGDPGKIANWSSQLPYDPSVTQYVRQIEKFAFTDGTILSGHDLITAMQTGNDDRIEAVI
ncbi:MAG: hypothetical protein KAG92_05230, partial [Deltaproteobacteria bacterium]|nr:hypothetical protein [Deltaproteobacteria bacterium]